MSSYLIQVRRPSEREMELTNYGPAFLSTANSPLEALNLLAPRALYFILQRDSQTKLGLTLEAMFTYLGK